MPSSVVQVRYKLQYFNVHKYFCSTEYFSFLDTAASDDRWKIIIIKKAMYIKWEKPIQNQQFKYLNLFLSI